VRHDRSSTFLGAGFRRGKAPGLDGPPNRVQLWHTTAGVPLVSAGELPGPAGRGGVHVDLIQGRGGAGGGLWGGAPGAGRAAGAEAGRVRGEQHGVGAGGARGYAYGVVNVAL